MSWTIEQVNSFAPDEGTIKRGNSTAKLNKWQKLERNDRAIWGECKGSGAQPYLTGVDLNGPAFKCSCPVARLPCKHVMALMFLYVQFFNNFQTVNPPAWLSEWLAKRDAKAVKVEKVVEKPEDDEELRKKEAAKVANFQSRIALMKGGFAEMEIWLQDVIRQGIASVEKQPYSFWNDVAARLVDTKSKGASNFIQEIPLLIHQHNWHEAVLVQLSDVYTLSQAFKHIENLPTPLQHDVLSVAGYTIPSKDLLVKNGIKDHWQILGKVQGTGVDEHILFRRIWLKGQKTGKYALLLDFTHTTQSFETHWSVGTATQAEIVYFPSNYPTRAKVKQQVPSDSFIPEFDGMADFQSFLKAFSLALAANPWLMDFPCMLQEVTPLIRDGKLLLMDKNQTMVPTADRDLLGWQLVALSGGKPISVFGEWTGNELVPLSAMVNGRFIDMSVG
jgi:hypothetical protein